MGMLWPATMPMTTLRCVGILTNWPISTVGLTWSAASFSSSKTITREPVTDTTRPIRKAGAALLLDAAAAAPSLPWVPSAASVTSRSVSIS
jgi:hypothetical protein